MASQPATAALTASAGSVRIGGNSVASQFFNGLIDEVRIFNDARTPAEIAADMNAPIIALRQGLPSPGSGESAERRDDPLLACASGR